MARFVSTRASNSCWTRDVEMQIRHAKPFKRHQSVSQNSHNSLKYTRSGLLAFFGQYYGKTFCWTSWRCATGPGPVTIFWHLKFHSVNAWCFQTVVFRLNCLMAPCFQVTLLGVIAMIAPIPLSIRICMDLLLGSPVSNCNSSDQPISLKKKLFMDWKETSILLTEKQQLGDFQPWMANWSWWALPKPDLFAMFGCWRPGETKI